MKLKIINTANNEVGTHELPIQFSEPVRDDLIRRAVVAILANKRQAYGTDPEAGQKQSTKLSRRRKDWKASYGHGISRVPRKTMSRNGTRFNWTGALAPMTVGGRVAHPPKSDKIWDQKINKKEKRKAIRSALSATILKELVQERGHIIPTTYPFALDNSFEQIQKTKDILASLEKIGFEQELERVQKRSVRAGRGKTRGRKYKATRGMLLVTSDICPLTKAAQNIIGVETISVRKLNAESLAPGTHAGRLTLFTDAALAIIEKEKLFTNNPQIEQTEKKKETQKKIQEKKTTVKSEKKEIKTEKKESKVETVQKKETIQKESGKKEVQKEKQTRLA